MASAQFNIDWQSTKKTVLERNRHMFNNPEFSDIVFTCAGSSRAFYAHKYVLATTSAVFKAMFYDKSAEKNQFVHLSDTDAKSFEEFLRFIYTDECNLTTDNIVWVMYLSKKYAVPSLIEHIKAQLVRGMKPGNVLDILEQAIHFGEGDLATKCWQIIEWRANEVTSWANFVNIKQTTLASLLKRNHLNVSEIELFQAVLRWIDHQCSQKGLALTTKNRRSIIGDAVYDLRLIAMNQEEFAKHVSKSGLLTAEELVPIYETFNKLKSPSLKWALPARKQTCDSTNEKIRISRFHSVFSDYNYSTSILWQYKSIGSRMTPAENRDYLSFSVDQCVLFLGVRFFAGVPESNVPHSRSLPRKSINTPVKYSVILNVCVNENFSGRNETSGQYHYDPQTNKHSVPGFDVMLKSPVLLKDHDVVTMNVTITGPPSPFGRRGQSTVKVQGITVNFIDSNTVNTRTCVSQGQFHEIILSI